MSGFIFRKLTPEESKQVYTKIAEQSNTQLFQSEIVRSLFLTAILFAFRIATDRTEPSLASNLITVVAAFTFILFFSSILAVIERRMAIRKLKGMK